MRRTVPVLVIALAAALAGGSLAAASAPVQGTIETENGPKTGLVKWSARSKSYAISQKIGGAMVDIETKLEDVTGIDIAKPAGYDAAVALVEKGQGAAAIPVLTRIVNDYVMLQWDKPAGRYLADAYLSVGNAEKALEACEKIIANDPSAAYKGELAPAYWKALLKLNKKSTLETALGKAAASGDRYSSGAALIMRGDMISEGGDSADIARKALVDGYLRVALLYTDPAVAPALRPEALSKAAKCFDKMQQTSRGEAMRSELKRLYPASPWATK